MLCADPLMPEPTDPNADDEFLRKLEAQFAESSHSAKDDCARRARDKAEDRLKAARIRRDVMDRAADIDLLAEGLVIAPQHLEAYRARLSERLVRLKGLQVIQTQRSEGLSAPAASLAKPARLDSPRQRALYFSS